MATRTLLLVAIKILGLFFLRDTLPLLPQMFAFVSFGDTSSSNGFWPLIGGFIALFAYGLLSYLLLFKSETVLRLLQLDYGLEETVDVRFHQSTVLQLATLIVGGLMVLTSVPNLLRQLFLYFQYASTKHSLIENYSRPDSTMLIVWTAQIIIGLLLLNNYRRVATYIEWKRRH